MFQKDFSIYLVVRSNGEQLEYLLAIGDEPGEWTTVFSEYAFHTDLSIAEGAAKYGKGTIIEYKAFPTRETLEKILKLNDSTLIHG